MFYVSDLVKRYPWRLNTVRGRSCV